MSMRMMFVDVVMTPKILAFTAFGKVQQRIVVANLEGLQVLLFAFMEDGAWVVSLIFT